MYIGCFLIKFMLLIKKIIIDMIITIIIFIIIIIIILVIFVTTSSTIINTMIIITSIVLINTICYFFLSACYSCFRLTHSRQHRGKEKIARRPKLSKSFNFFKVPVLKFFILASKTSIWI